MKRETADSFVVKFYHRGTVCKDFSCLGDGREFRSGLGGFFMPLFSLVTGFISLLWAVPCSALLSHSEEGGV